MEFQISNNLPCYYHSTDENATLNREGLSIAKVNYHVYSSTNSETIGDAQKAYIVSINGATNSQ